MTDGDFDQVHAQSDDETASKPTEQTSTKDELLEYLWLGQFEKAAGVLRQLDNVDRDVLRVLAFMLDGNTGGEFPKDYYKFRLVGERWKNRRPKRQTIDFPKAEAVRAVARKLKENPIVKTALHDVANELAKRVKRGKSYGYVKAAWYAEKKRKKATSI